MSYTKTNWQNLPSTSTPLNATNLNKIETELEALDLRNVKGELLTISGSTNSSGNINSLSITQDYANTPYIISNISENFSTPYNITVSGYNSSSHLINIRVRNISDNSAVTSTAINTVVLVVGI